jgi:hypothetical protein
MRSKLPKRKELQKWWRPMPEYYNNKDIGEPEAFAAE